MMSCTSPAHDRGSLVFFILPQTQHPVVDPPQRLCAYINRAKRPLFSKVSCHRCTSRSPSAISSRRVSSLLTYWPHPFTHTHSRVPHHNLQTIVTWCYACCEIAFSHNPIVATILSTLYRPRQSRNYNFFARLTRNWTWDSITDTSNDAERFLLVKI